MVNRGADLDYLAVTTRVRALEGELLNRSVLDRLLQAETAEKLAEILQECGYPACRPADLRQIDSALAQTFRTLLADLADSVPDLVVLDLFRLRDDYHNLKVILKARAVRCAPERMLAGAGRITASALLEALESGDLAVLPGDLAQAAAEGERVLAAGWGMQRCDMLLDAVQYETLRRIAWETGDPFLQRYVRLRIDAVNLRTLVRVRSLGREDGCWQEALLAGGGIPPEALTESGAWKDGSFAELYAGTPLAAAARDGAAVRSPGTLGAFEGCCARAELESLSGAEFLLCGPAPLVRYLAVRRAELTDVRTLLMGRAAGAAPETLRARLCGRWED